MTLWATLEYLKNEDVIEISYRKFDQTKGDSQYPAMSLCFVDAYKQSELEKWNNYSSTNNTNIKGSMINASSYSDFINGNIWDEKMLNISYEKVTFDIKDYLMSTCMITTMSKTCQKIHKIDTLIFPSPLGVLKCFSFQYIIESEYNLSSTKNINSNKQNLDEVMLSIKNSIFPNGIRPSSGRFLVMFHYPFQLVRSIYRTLYNWPSQKNSSTRYYAMQFYIKSIETLKRRIDGNQECYDWEKYDSKTMEDVMQSVGCHPPYWKSYNKLAPCMSAKQMKDIASHYQAKLYQDDQFGKVVPPCVEIKKVDVEFEEDIGDNSKNKFSNDFYEQFATEAGTKHGWFIIHLHFWSSIDFKEIKQIKAYSIMSAIGNASGYVGVLVGISMSQLPHLVLWTISKMKHYGGIVKQLFVGPVSMTPCTNGCDPEMANGIPRNANNQRSGSLNEMTEIYMHEALI